jgi:hypothetical protein
MLDEQLQELAPGAPTRSVTGTIDEHALRKGSRYWIGGGLIAFAVIGAIVWAIVAVFGVAGMVNDFQRVEVPGSATVGLDARKADRRDRRCARLRRRVRHRRRDAVDRDLHAA